MHSVQTDGRTLHLSARVSAPLRQCALGDFRLLPGLVQHRLRNRFLETAHEQVCEPLPRLGHVCGKLCHLRICASDRTVTRRQFVEHQSPRLN